MPIPCRRASAGPLSETATPLTRIDPASGAYSPAATFISDDLPAPFSPSRACTSPAWLSKDAPSRASAPSKDLRMPASCSAGVIGRERPRVFCARLFLSYHPWHVPIHLPEPAIVERFAIGDALDTAGILDRPGEDLLAGDDGVALGHHLVHDLLGHNGVAAGDIGAAILDAGECTIRARLPVSGGDFFQLRR